MPLGQLRSSPIALDGQTHFRDLGGLPTRQGHRVKHGVLFRSGELSRLSDSDGQALEGLGIRTVFDLRAESEQQHAPDRLPATIRLRPIPILQGSFDPTAILQQLKSGDTAALDELMPAIYRSLVVDFTLQFRQFFQELAASPGGILFHCTAGKDRTGLAAALLLAALQVPAELIEQDYLASNASLATLNERIAARFAPYGVTLPQLEPLLTVRSGYLQAAFAEIETRWGNLGRYLDEGLGIDRPALQKRFLYPA
ncbi:tyrosine-protein phosphatase [Crenobacter sp. SG2305]|uniref:tyrosine-protein phosphatase n=1 Tax=Crenobacter oryzisoli TaxID=3056844 RepID=UPI0025AAC597|nr:tyrosine-protein phosphatase [Crenobacter sp. SG2305]MDN0085063.1 tyrosine-protein phosphatase [Crenobacter sp. SG2305]